MTVDINANGYTALRERKPLIEWCVELQSADGTPIYPRLPLAAHRTSEAGENPMLFAFPIVGSYAPLPCRIDRVVLFEDTAGGLPTSDPETIDPLLVVQETDRGSISLTVTLPGAA